MYLEESVRTVAAVAVVALAVVVDDVDVESVVILSKIGMDYKAGCSLYSYYAQFFKPFWFKNNINAYIIIIINNKHITLRANEFVRN